MKYKQIITALAGLMLSASTLASEGGNLEHANINVFDTAASSRGARLFVDYCSGCHSAKYMRYKRLADDLGYSESDVLTKLAKPGSKIGDAMTVSLSKEDGAALFGVPPPDLSLVARTRGADWLFTYLKSFYRDESRSMGWNNTVFPNASMPHVLWELQGIQHIEESHGDEHASAEHAAPKLILVEKGAKSAEEYDATLRDLVTFLQYLGEPAQLERRQLGVWVILFLVLFTFLSYLLKVEFWKDVKK